MPRCNWADSDQKMRAYHDKEWGRPEHDEQKLFELMSLDELLWQAVDYEPCINHFTKPEQVPAKTEISLELAKKLKKQGFKFLGPTIVYSLMQAAGLVNDHLVGCPEKFY